MMSLAVTILLLVVSVFTFFYTVKQRASLKTELKVARLVSELGWIEAEYWGMVNKNKFLHYPNIKRMIAQTSDINAFIADNPFDWHKKIKIVPVFIATSKSDAELRAELKNCADDTIKELFNKKNKSLMNIYSIQRPIRCFMLKLIFGVFVSVIVLALSPIVLVYILARLGKAIIEIFKNAQKIGIAYIFEAFSYLLDGFVNSIKESFNFFRPNSFYMKQAL